MKILIVNGPSLNFLGVRETEVYGKTTYKELIHHIEKYAHGKKIKTEFYQSNSEGDIIDKLQEAYIIQVDGIIINPGAYAHYSYAIRDAIQSISIKTVEVHLTDIYNREDFRKVSVTAPVCEKCIVGKGIDGYIEAIQYLCK